MKTTALIFFVAFCALASSWSGFVLAPQIQFGRASQTNTLGGDLYPYARPGQAKLGLDVYRANGCVACHSQQVGQDGTHCEIVLVDAGTNALATLAALASVNPDLAKPTVLAALPKTVAQLPSVDEADPIVKLFAKSGAKTDVEIVPVGPDIARGWGKRHTVAQDYLYDYPVQLGTRRIGPDLADVGARQPDLKWHLLHLYAPTSEVKGSLMPPYLYLFEKRKIDHAPSPDALQLPPALTPPDGYEIVPTAQAIALAQYLVSLRADAPLYEAPLTPPPAPPAATNAPVSTAAK